MVIIKGAGDIATGIAFRLVKSGFKVIMTETPHPTSIRRTVCFSQAIIKGETTVEDITAKFAKNTSEALKILDEGFIPVLSDEEAECVKILKPDVLVDAILAKKNLGTKISDAPKVICVGPGFSAGYDCHYVIETNRGHFLGRVIEKGEASPNTGVPGNIDGYTIERILRAPQDGIFVQNAEIGDLMKKGDIAGFVGDTPMICSIDGVLRGILPTGTPVFKGMKSGDIDPRCEKKHCYTVSDKALSIGGGVLEAILRR